jgi:hypothetical protein
MHLPGSAQNMQAQWENGVKVIVKSLPVWLMIIPLSVLNGAVRGCVMQPLLGSYALPASGITLCALVLGLTWFFIPRLGGRPGSVRWLGLCGPQ